MNFYISKALNEHLPPGLCQGWRWKGLVVLMAGKTGTGSGVRHGGRVGQMIGLLE